MLVERIREVRALMGFTRIESNADFAEATNLGEGRLTKLSRESPKWLPASEVRGEGIFLRIREEILMAWQDKPELQQLQHEFLESHKAWRTLRKLEPASEHFPGIRLVLLHSLAHALMRQIVLDCGYAAASVRERLYARQPGEDGGPMAGILLYTAAPDSEGTLGGLVELEIRSHWVATYSKRWRVCAFAPLTHCVLNIGQTHWEGPFKALAAMPASLRPKLRASAATATLTGPSWSIRSQPPAPHSSIELCVKAFPRTYTVSSHEPPVLG